MSKKALVHQLAEQFLFLAETSPSQGQIDSTLQDKSFFAWRTLVHGVMDAYDSAQEVLIGMSVEARQLLLDYLREEMQPNLVRSAGQACWAQLGPLLAAKLALCFHLCLLGLKSQVSAEVMRDAIGMARWLVSTSVQTRTVLGQEQAELNLQRHAQRLLARIPKDRPIGWRALRRRFNPQLIALHQPAVDYLLASRTIVRHPDGSIERVPH